MTKGRDAERTLRQHYEAAGFECYHPPHAKYREADVFGLFDLLAFGHGKLEAAQVKASRDAAGIHDWFESASLYAEHLDDVVIAFAHQTDGCWRIARRTPGGYRWVHDGREQSDVDGLGLLEILRRQPPA
jgi:hypothetical protein